MSNNTERAKKWELDLAGRFGQAVAQRRKALGLTAATFAVRTADLGYPISRQTIAKIESNNRAGKVDVAELIVLAAVLNVSPLQLLYPDLVDGPVDVFPGNPVTSVQAVNWFSGEGVPYPNTEGEREAADNLEFGEVATDPLLLARGIDKDRRWISEILQHPKAELSDGTALRVALTDLSDKKKAARRLGMIVEDERDA